MANCSYIKYSYISFFNIIYNPAFKLFEYLFPKKKQDLK